MIQTAESRLTSWIYFALILSLFSNLISCQIPPDDPHQVDDPLIIPQIAFPQLSFELPVDIQSPPDQSHRFFVVEQKGLIKVFENRPDVQQSSIFLDISDQVFTGHGEEGLLGLAFHPNFRMNGYFYVYHSAYPPRRSTVARFQISSEDPNKASPLSKTIILEIPQPYGNHNGGQIQFGPDGYLYIALGDGGGAGDPESHGQNRSTLLGSLLRIDVDHPDNKKNYGIPSDNPFIENQLGYREEIYAYGLRNPWRFSIDPMTGWIWLGDVGQDKPNEEINVVFKGKNYGWNIMEGQECFHPPVNCKQTGLELPIWTYTANDGRSITGGYVYRGKAIPDLYGSYIYADFLSGRIWALDYDGRNLLHNRLLHQNNSLYISSFGIDQDQELYFCSFDGHIYKFSYGKIQNKNQDLFKKKSGNL